MNKRPLLVVGGLVAIVGGAVVGVWDHRGAPPRGAGAGTQGPPQ